MPDTVKLRCHTDGCGHNLELHEVAPTARCRVTGCLCDKWRAFPDRKSDPRADLAWEDARVAWLKGHAVVVMPRLDPTEGPVTMEAVRLAMVKAGLGIGSDESFPVTVVYVQDEFDET